VTPGAPVTLSVVIPTFGRQRVLRDTLDALLALDLAGCEVIVVDQNPRHDDATRDYLHAVAGRIRRLPLAPPGLPRARNAGWRAAEGEIVLFLDDDVLPHPGLVAGHRRRYADPAVGGVAGRVVTRGFPLPEHPSPRSRWPGVGWLFFNLAQTVPAEVASARGCNMSFRRSVLAELGGFDERFAPSPYRNESDLCFRLRRRGYRLVFEPEAAVEHLQHEEGGVRAGGRDEALSPSRHVDNFRFFWRHVPWWHRPLTLLVFLAQEFWTRRARALDRSWRDQLRILGLFARGAWVAYRARDARGEAPPPGP
jgi:GT2 family glycosyltransferase